MFSKVLGYMVKTKRDFLIVGDLVQVPFAGNTRRIGWVYELNPDFVYDTVVCFFDTRSSTFGYKSEDLKLLPSLKWCEKKIKNG